MHVTHGPRLKVALLQPPLLPVEAIILHVLLHHLIFRVKQHVTGRARSSVLHVVHWNTLRNSISAVHKPRSRRPSSASALTFIIGKLKVVIHGGHKLLHKEAPDARRQALLTPDLTVQNIRVEICRRRRRRGEHVGYSVGLELTRSYLLRWGRSL